MIVSSVSWEKAGLSDVLLQKVSEVLRIDRGSIKVYYEYSRQTTEFFFYKELYVFVDCGNGLRASIARVFAAKEKEFVKLLLDELNTEAVVQIADVYSVENQRALICLWYGVSISVCLGCCALLYVVFYKRKKERRENLYLLQYSVC